MTGADSAAGVSATRRVGYAIAIAVNAAVLWFVHQLLDWGWPPWLTADFEQVLPAISRSLIASILANAAYLLYDKDWFKALTQIVVLVISLQATIAILRVFPFDFSAYQFDFDVVARVILVVAIIGIFIAIISEVVKLVRAVSARQQA